MTDTNREAAEQRWVIVRDGTELTQDERFLSDSQEWSTLDKAMTFGRRLEAEGGSVTLCPAFTTGHAEAVACY